MLRNTYEKLRETYEKLGRCKNSTEMYRDKYRVKLLEGHLGLHVLVGDGRLAAPVAR